MNRRSEEGRKAMAWGPIATAAGLLMVSGAGWGQQLQQPQLLAPSNGTLIPQNVQSPACAHRDTGDYGYSIPFAWSAVTGAARYELLVEHEGSATPAVDRTTEQLSYEDRRCGAFVAEVNLTQWVWRVRALPETGEPGPWSETGHFAFAPCRLADGAPCRAPARMGVNATGSSSEPDADGVYRIGGDVAAPMLLQKVEPQYTEEARKACFSGTALLSLVIDEQGVPRDIRVRRPVGLGLDQAAVEAVLSWRFKPGAKNGRPVAVRAQVEVNFKVQCKQN